MKRYYQIAIDGPAGSGKSTIAKLIARKLGFLYIDSGAMYRAVTFYVILKDLLNRSKKEIKKHIKEININFMNKRQKTIVFLNNKDVTNEIRTSRVNKLVSEISSMKVIRDEMVNRQRRFAKESSVVMDGRDIGTTVFKDAPLKIYLTASSYIRAKRRKQDLKKMQEHISLKELVKQINFRDNYDSSRAISPLCKSQDAVVIDSTNLNVNQVLDYVNFFLPRT